MLLVGQVQCAVWGSTWSVTDRRSATIAIAAIEQRLAPVLAHHNAAYADRRRRPLIPISASGM